jgi:type IV secretion system protein VirB7
MKARLLIVALTTALAGCASAGRSDAPVCDGKHRRPVNLHGSRLDPASAPPSAASSADAAAATPVYPGCGQ